MVSEGALVCDLRGRLPGRGAWLHPDRECLRKAERRRAFRRALRVPQDSGTLDVTSLADHLATVTHPDVGSSRA
ncbi:MAG: DUF448 domain-containing protein [Sciscionella sp.]